MGDWVGRRLRLNRGNPGNRHWQPGQPSATQAAAIGNPDNRRQPKQPPLATRITVGNPSNRRSGESRNPGNPREKYAPQGKGAWFDKLTMSGFYTISVSSP